MRVDSLNYIHTKIMSIGTENETWIKTGEPCNFSIQHPPGKVLDNCL